MDWDRLSSISVVQVSSGKVLPLASLWRDKRIILAFVRHFACLSCQVQIAALNLAKEQLSTLDIPIVLIGCASLEQGREFVSNSDLSLPGELYLDLERKSHQAVGLHRGIYQSLISPIIDGLPKYGWKGIVEGIRLARESYHLVGDSWQQGGLFLVGPGRDARPGDWANLTHIINNVICPPSTADSGPAVTIDYSKALRSCLHSREEKRKELFHRIRGPPVSNYNNNNKNGTRLL